MGSADRTPMPQVVPSGAPGHMSRPGAGRGTSPRWPTGLARFWGAPSRPWSPRPWLVVGICSLSAILHWRRLTLPAMWGLPCRVLRENLVLCLLHSLRRQSKCECLESSWGCGRLPPAGVLVPGVFAKPQRTRSTNLLRTGHRRGTSGEAHNVRKIQCAHCREQPCGNGATMVVLRESWLGLDLTNLPAPCSGGEPLALCPR